MKRPDYVGHHSGQISFPGGKEEPGDDSLQETAKRETFEEIGVTQNKVKIIGKLSDLDIPISNFLVHPFVGYMTESPIFCTDPKEVAYLITCPVKTLLGKPILQTKMTFNDTVFDIPYYNINGEVIWGATPMILREFIEVAKKVISDFCLH